MPATAPETKAARAAEIRLAWAYVAADAAGPAADSAALVDGGRRRFRAEGDLLVRAEGGAEHLLVPVAAYRELPPRRRPRSFCPVCLERVWLKLGARNRAHYAHLAGSDCAAARGEGALHHAAKVHLAAALAGGGPIRVRPLCHRIPEERDTERCAIAPESEWPVRWDEVRVEHSLPPLRADLTLMRGGEVVAAIEVFATHAVDGAKAEKYRGLGIPWIEVPARAVLPDHGVGWSADDALAILGDHRLHPEVWRCARHEALHRGLIEHELNGVHRLARRIVHVYRTDGGRSAGEVRCRVVGISMLERREGGRLAEAWLEREDTGARLGAPARTGDRDEARRVLHARFNDWVRWMRRANGVAIDTPMRWMEGGEPLPRDGARAFPERLRWDAHAGEFRGVPDLPALAWPPVPPLAGDPHPVLGHTPRAWTETHPRKGDLLHATEGAVWLTLFAHAWGEDGGTAVRADVAAHVHDGRRWRGVEGAPFTASLHLAPGATAPWHAMLPALAHALAARDPESLLDGSVARAVVDEWLRSHRSRVHSFAP
jgi:hypothetical protein